VPPDDFFDEDWEEPSRTQDTAITRPSGEPADRGRGAEVPPESPRPRVPRPPQRPRKQGQRRGPQMPRMPKLPKLPGSGSGGGGGAAVSLPPLEYRRLAGLGVGILVVIVVLVLLARSCSGSSAKSSNEAYVQQLTTKVLRPSDDVAQRFAKTINLPRASLKLMQTRIDAQLADMKSLRAAAIGLKPTKQLLPYQAALLEALQFRITGLQCMSEGLKTAWATKHTLAAGSQLTSCTGRLLTSDYVYSDSFASGANAALKKVGAAGVPTSQFLSGQEVDLVTPAGIGAALQRLHPGAVKGLHGTQMLSVVASPAGKTLQAGPANFVVGNQSLVFVAAVKNGGNFQEVSVPVKLTLQQVGSSKPPITKTVTIASIAKGATQDVRFPGLFANSQNAPNYSVQYKLTVRSEKVPGEHVVSNNVLSFTVVFKIS